MVIVQIVNFKSMQKLKWMTYSKRSFCCWFQAVANSRKWSLVDFVDCFVDHIRCLVTFLLSWCILPENYLQYITLSKSEKISTNKTSTNNTIWLIVVERNLNFFSFNEISRVSSNLLQRSDNFLHGISQSSWMLSKYLPCWLIFVVDSQLFSWHKVICAGFHHRLAGHNQRILCCFCLEF